MENARHKNNLATIMITHNMTDAIRVGNRLIVMHEGQIVVDVKGEGDIIAALRKK